MFKKTLLALALTGLAGTTVAAEIDDTKVTYSAEGIEFVSSLSLASVDVKLESVNTGTVATPAYYEYQAGDKLVFTFPNDKFAVGTDAKVSVDVGGTDTDLGLSPSYTGSNKVTFTLDAAAITAASTAITKDRVITLSGVVLESNNLNAGGKVKVDYNSVSGLNASSFDAADEVVVADVEKQFDVKATATVLDAKVDVSEDRLVFADGSKSDSFNVELQNKSSLSNAISSIEKIVYTLSGDFSFLDTDADGEADYTVSGIPGTVKIAEDFQTLVYTDTSLTSAASTAVVIEATDGTTVIPTGDFTLSTELTYKAGGKDQVENYSFSVGKWELNGFEGKATFLPFGSQYAQSITVANTGSVDGAITVELTAGGKTEAKTLTAVSTADSVVDISNEVKAFAAELGINGNAALNIIVDAPLANIGADVVYYAKADKDRVKTR